MPVIDISPLAASHLVRALQRHRKEMAAMGVGVPDDLKALEEHFSWLWNSDRAEVVTSAHGVTRGQARSISANPAGSVDADAMTTPDTRLTRAETATRLRVSPSTVKRLEKSGALPAQRVGRAVRYRLADVDNLGNERNL